MRLARFSFLLFIASGAAFSQDTTVWDASGDGLLNGNYNFRQVAWTVADSFGNLSQTSGLYGSITFDGFGHYNMTGTFFNPLVGLIPTTVSGTYRISASGLGFLTPNPSFPTGGAVWGSVSQGIFIGSSTEDGVNDLFIAAPAPTTAPTIASLGGKFWIADMNFPSLNPGQARDSMFQINPDGQGNLGTLNITGYIGGSAAAVSQTVAGAHYSPAGNGFLVTYGGTLTNSNLVTGSRLLYMSPDGNFVFGGSTNNADFFVGVRAISGAAPANLLNGLYFQAGVDEDLSALTGGFANLATYFGTFNAQSGGIVGHQRLLTGFAGTSSVYDAYDYTYSDSLTVNSDGTQDDFFGQHHAIGVGGTYRIGFGKGPFPGINVAIRAPNFSGSGVFLNPTGVTNAASEAPFSVGVARGEFIELRGTGLAASALASGSFPTTLNNVRVLINGRFAPIYFVSPTLITAVVPFGTSGTVTSIQVINNGVMSNTITVFVNTTAPGVYTTPLGGAGYVVAQHLDFSTITPANPAHAGETILVYLTGLGDVNPAVPDGVAAPLNILSRTTASIGVFIDSESATILFSGLVPTLVADYALVVTIPPDILPGNVFLDVSGPDSYTSEAFLPIAAGGRDSAAAVEGSAESARVPTPRRRPARMPRNTGGLDTGSRRLPN